MAGRPQVQPLWEGAESNSLADTLVAVGEEGMARLTLRPVYPTQDKVVRILEPLLGKIAASRIGEFARDWADEAGMVGLRLGAALAYTAREMTFASFEDWLQRAIGVAKLAGYEMTMATLEVDEKGRPTEETSK